MDEKLSGVEASAISLLKRAVEMDTAHRFTEALVCYQEGIQLLLDVCKGTSVGSTFSAHSKVWCTHPNMINSLIMQNVHTDLINYSMVHSCKL